MTGGVVRWVAVGWASAWASACTVNLGGADRSDSAPDAVPVVVTRDTGGPSTRDPATSSSSSSSETTRPTGSGSAADTGLGPDPAALGGAGSAEIDGVAEAAIGCTYAAAGYLRYRLWFAPNAFLDLNVTRDGLSPGSYAVEDVWLVDGADDWSYEPREANGAGAMDLDIAAVDAAFAVDGASSGQVRVEDYALGDRTVTAVTLVGCTPEW